MAAGGVVFLVNFSGSGSFRFGFSSLLSLVSCKKIEWFYVKL